jgi:tripartite-type tricarboxylate transporter receptor subunit TctC
MDIHRRALLGVAAALAWTASMAQLPSGRPVRIIVPFPPGGPVDLLARGIAQEMGEALGQIVVVDNKPGANTIIAAEAVAKAAPDGLTLLLATDATISINPLIYAKLPYSPQADLEPLCAVARVPEYLVVRSDLPVRTLKEFIALAKAKPEELNYGSFGRGSNAHLEFEALNMSAGIKVAHIPFKGAAEVYPAMLAGRIDAAISSIVAPLPHIRASKLRALAVMGAERSVLLPDVPTFTESGVSGFESDAWFGFFAPARTPAAVLGRLHAAIATTVVRPAFRERYLDAIGLAPAPPSKSYFTTLLQENREKYARYVQAAKLTPE